MNIFNWKSRQIFVIYQRKKLHEKDMTALMSALLDKTTTYFSLTQIFKIRPTKPLRVIKHLLPEQTSLNQQDL